MELSDPRFLLFAAIVLLAFVTEAATGFGATVITLTLAAHFLRVDLILPVFVPVGLVLSVVIVARQRAHVDGALLSRSVLPLMGAGVAIGLAVFDHVSSAGLRLALGVFVVAVALQGLWQLRPRPAGGAADARPPLPAAVRGAALVGAGVIHGLFASGGPLLVWALGRSALGKGAFRATLSSVWLIFGVVLVASYAWRGLLGADSLRASAALLPVLALALALGERLHHRLDELRFRRVVYALLLVAGLTNVF